MNRQREGEREKGHGVNDASVPTLATDCDSRSRNARRASETEKVGGGRREKEQETARRE